MDYDTSDSRIARLATLGAFAAPVLAALALLGFYLTADFRRILTVVPDDVGYFFEIGRNLAETGRSTFDGLYQTNGYQPLWGWIVTGMHALGQSSPETMLRAGLVLQLAMVAGAGVLVVAALRRLFRPMTCLAVSVLLTVLTLIPAVNGMESSLLILMLAVLLWAAGRLAVVQGATRWGSLVFGVLLGLVMLARLDMVFLGMFTCGLLFLRAVCDKHNRSVWWGRFLLVSLGATVVVAPYLVYNHVVFGRIMPISGLLKSSFPVPGLYVPAGWVFRTRMWGCLAAAGLYLVWFIVRRRWRSSDAHRGYETLLAVLAASVCAHFAHTVLFMRWAVMPWHFLPYALFASLLAALIIRGFISISSRWGFAQRAGWMAWPVIVLLAVGGGVVAARRYRQNPDVNWQVRTYEAALWARESTAPEAIFGYKDAGVFGYFSDRRTVNLDGIVNNLAYQQALRDGRLGEYLRSNGVEYLVIYDQPDGSGSETFIMKYPCRLHPGVTGSVRLRRDDAVFRSGKFPSMDGSTASIVIYRLPRD
ncbi:MAG: hypothetical protein HN350_20890 [Phycisphaerales bacterium]|jgi:hypothetical protein|nr:hypothetical protein [Phycisphaerales bacterium]